MFERSPWLKEASWRGARRAAMIVAERASTKVDAVDGNDGDDQVDRPQAAFSDLAQGEGIVSVQQVDKWFGDNHVLQQVDLEVGRGQVVVVIGPSGSGKSTLCRCINRLERIDGGRILVDGQPLPEEGKPLAHLRADVGMVFQSFNLFAHKTVLDNVTMAPIRVRKLSKQQAREDATALLERVGLPDKGGAYPAELSGGQQQRVAIARALAMRPKVMLFDEPTSALDPEMIAEVLDVMSELAAEGRTMLVVSHEMGFASNAADLMCFMDGGRIIESAPPRQFFDHPQTERARSFLSKILAH
jgi:glutamate transport system ATP-binding protein